MMAPLSFKSFSLLHEKICLQADEKVQAQRRADNPKIPDPKDVESEAHGPEKETLSENADAAEKVKAA